MREMTVKYRQILSRLSLQVFLLWIFEGKTAAMENGMKLCLARRELSRLSCKMINWRQSKCCRRWESFWKGIFPPCWFVSLGVNEPAFVLFACTAEKRKALGLLVAPGEKGRKTWNLPCIACQNIAVSLQHPRHNRTALQSDSSLAGIEKMKHMG